MSSDRSYSPALFQRGRNFTALTGCSSYNIWSEAHPRSSYCASPPTEARVAPVVIMWYHHVLWVCYFCLDFALRLLTLGLFLSTGELKAFHAPVLSLLLLAYFMAVALPIQLFEAEGSQPEFWQIGEQLMRVERQVVFHRVSDGLIMAFLVHILPADIRMAPKASHESRALLTLDPEVRRRIMGVVMPLRSFDYALLGASAMVYRYDGWQCLALVSLYVAMHFLLAPVLFVQRQMSQRFGTDHPVPDEVLKEVKRLSTENIVQSRQNMWKQV